jgi:hypothetical protein
VAAGKHKVEVEDLDFSYDLFTDGFKVASFAEVNVSKVVGLVSLLLGGRLSLGSV